MKVPKLLAVLSILIVIFSSGCTSSTTPNLDEEIYRGTRALTMNFLQDVPPTETFASTGDEYEMAIELKNEGTYPVYGKIYFSGFDPNIISFSKLGMDQGYSFPSSNCGFKEIIPRSKLNPPGGACVEEFKGKLNLDSITDSYSANIFAQAVYKYITDASIVMCVDPDVYHVSPAQRACTMSAFSSGSGQGAPLGITKIEPTAIGGGQILYRIYIQNMGEGEVVDYMKAPYELKPSDVGKVRYRIGTPANTRTGITVSANGGSVFVGNAIADITGRAIGLSYTDSNFRINFNPKSNYAYSEDVIRLNNGQGVITKVIDYSGNAYAFQTPLQITLEYGYMHAVQKNIEIVNIDQYNSAYGAGGIRFVYDKNGKRVELNPDGSVRYRDDDFQIDLPSDTLDLNNLFK
ncbi:MAG: hypothetical protein WC471_00825 [Candidatus Woesearchaeota archaeon]